jgi:hypothetical protein
MFDTKLLLLLGAISIAAVLGVIVYELFMRRWVKGRLRRWRRRHQGHHRRHSGRL